ncbi:MAG: hypothetical protein KAR40_06135 [Candidatus Sabulitectum sp.]|nr:hypothetical protein [Candidatus Sabulitectum sp.]
MSLKDEIKNLLQSTLDSAGAKLKGDVDELAIYTAERAVALQMVAGLPGFDQAVIAERDNVMLKASILVTEGADHADQLVMGVITGALHIAATL